MLLQHLDEATPPSEQCFYCVHWEKHFIIIPAHTARNIFMLIGSFSVGLAFWRRVEEITRTRHAKGTNEFKDNIYTKNFVSLFFFLSEKGEVCWRFVSWKLYDVAICSIWCSNSMVFVKWQFDHGLELAPPFSHTNTLRTTTMAFHVLCLLLLLRVSFFFIHKCLYRF